ncbi:hypothetical protein [Pseudoalteromonas sp.]|uniref:hypothetical protein n=1 Tax=Pseudoalteromonas sp. TaxID=53249 RepID=UPI003D147A57
MDGKQRRAEAVENLKDVFVANIYKPGADKTGKTTVGFEFEFLQICDGSFLKNLFHADLAKTEDSYKLDNYAVGTYELGTDYYDVIEMATPAMLVNTTDGVPNWQTIAKTIEVWKEYFNVLFPKNYQMAITQFHITGNTLTFDNMVTALNNDLQCQLIYLPEADVEAKHMTLDPIQLPSRTKITPDKIKLAVLSDLKEKNNVDGIAPQINIQVSSTTAIKLLMLGTKHDDLKGQTFSDEVGYLKKLVNLHTELLKTLTSDIGDDEKDINNPSDKYIAAHIIAYYLTSVTGIPAEVRAKVRQETKVIFTEQLRKPLVQKRAKIARKCWTYTHSWVKDVAHLWIKCTPFTLIDGLENPNNVVEQIKILAATDLSNDSHIKFALENIGAQLNYDEENKNFIKNVLGELTNGSKKVDRAAIYTAYDYNEEKYAEDGIVQTKTVFENAKSAFEYYQTDYGQWARKETFLPDLSNKELVVEIRDSCFLNTVNEAWKDGNIDCKKV